MNNLNVDNYQPWYASANAEEKAEFREWLRGVLKSETVCLTFKKKDDTIREMRCTLKESELPVHEEKTTTVVRKENLDSLPVFDLDKKEWRAFRFDSVQKIEFTIGV